MSIIPLSDIAPALVDDLLDRAFGPGRTNRTAYKIRDGADVIDALSFGWVEDGSLIGSLQCWPVSLSAPDGTDYRMIMVGPVAVVPNRQNQGIGIAMMDRTMAIHDAWPKSGHLPMMMIGDAPYYGRWNFAADNTQGWRVPGPVERDRLLVRKSRDMVLPLEGTLGPES